MTQRSLVLLAIATLIVIAAAWVVVGRRTPQTDVQKTPLYPDLVNRVNDVARIEIKAKDKNTVIVKQGDAWRIENRGNFSALFEKVKSTVMGVADARILEAKTKNTELYPRLGVEEVDAQGSSSKLLSLLDQGGQKLVSVIVGKERSAAAGPSRPAHYVRKTGDAQAFLVEGELELSADPPDWLDREMFSVAADRIHQVTIQHPGQNAVQIHRKDAKTTDYTLDNIPGGSKVKSQVSLNGLAAALENLRLDDVVPRTNFTLPPEHTVTKFTTFDGMIATATTAKIDDRVHASFEFSYDAEVAKRTEGAEKSDQRQDQTQSADTASKDQAAGDRAKSEDSKPKQSVDQEVVSLNDKVRDWIYVIPEYKAAMLSKKMDELVASAKEDKPKVPLPSKGSSAVEHVPAASK